ncbi:MAG: ATP-binding protein [Chloroflexota bacterium]
MGAQFVIQIPSVMGYEKKVISQIASLASQIAFPPAKIDDLRTALGEAIINAIEHGNGFLEECPVTILVEHSKQSLIIEVRDTAKVPIPKVPLTHLPRDDHRGWGLPLIQYLADEAYSEAMLTQNRLRLCFYREVSSEMITECH